MNIPLLNLLGDTVLQRQQRRLRIFLITTYSIIWLFSISVLLYTYRTNLFISSLYARDAAKINHEISRLQPKLLIIEQLYRQRQNNIEKIKLFQQNSARPLNWAQKLETISRLIPSNMRLAEIKVVPLSSISKKPGVMQPRMMLSGLSLIDSKHQDLNFINIFSKKLEADATFISEFKHLEIMQNRIEIKNGQPQINFVLGVY